MSNLGIDFRQFGGTLVSKGRGKGAWDFGWQRDPAAVETVLESLDAEGKPRTLAAAAPHLLAADDDAPVFLWEAEKKLFGRVFPSWDQSDIGSCVSHGSGRGAQDLGFVEIAAGEPEAWPQKNPGEPWEVCREAIYGGSRVEVGGGRIRGDGSVGAWAARWVKDWGVVLYGRYGSRDISDGYSVSRCREWGDRGCPDDLEPEAKKHPVREVAMVTTFEEAWAAVGGGKPVVICSDVGFDSPLAEGVCRRSGSWAHCMVYRGRARVKYKGGVARVLVNQNSWGDYLRGKGEPALTLDDGRRVELPMGCFGMLEDDCRRVLAQEDSFAYAGLTGWAATRVDYQP